MTKSPSLPLSLSLSALLLSSGAIGLSVAQNGTQLDPPVGDAAPVTLDACGGCGWGCENSCATKDDEVQVGVWLCKDMSTCGCKSYFGCDSADFYREWNLNVNDWQGNVICDTLGGWRWDDEGYNGAYGQWYTGVHVEVHPADYGKIGGYAGNVKVQATKGDYCTGAKVWDTPLSAWDDDNDKPGDWWFYKGSDPDYYPDPQEIKALRPYIDFENMWGSPAAVPEAGVGFKINVWPNRHMAHPYDQDDLCPLEGYRDASGQWQADSWGGYNLPGYDCQKPEDRTYCLPPTGEEPGHLWPEGGVWDTAWWNTIDNNEVQSHYDGNGNPMVPAGSILFGLYDGGMAPRDGCDISRSEYCWSGNYDPDNTCLAVRLYNEDDWDKDWEWDSPFIAETKIQMSTFCDDETVVCINTTDGSGDGDEAKICYNNWFTYPGGTPFYNDDGSEQLWFTHMILQVEPNCSDGHTQ